MLISESLQKKRGLHDGPVFHARVVRQTKDAPEHNVLVVDLVLAGRRVAHATDLVAAHHGPTAAGVELVVLVLGDPEVVAGKEGAVGLDGARRGEEQLRRRAGNLVADGLAANGVLLALVLNLEDAVAERVEVEAGGLCDGGSLDVVKVAVGVGRGVDGGGQALLLDERVGVAVDGRVEAQTKNVLVVLGDGARVDNVAPGRRLAGVHIDDGDDAGGASLERDAGGLVEDKGKDVLVVGEGENVLDDELAAAGDDGAAGAPVGVLPVDAVVLLVQADDVFGGLG